MATKTVGSDQVGIRELKTQLSFHLRRVKNGACLTVTEHGRPVARILPEKQSEADRMQALVRSGVLERAGRKLRLRPPAGKVKSGFSVAALVSEGRD